MCLRLLSRCPGPQSVIHNVEPVLLYWEQSRHQEAGSLGLGGRLGGKNGGPGVDRHTGFPLQRQPPFGQCE